MLERLCRTSGTFINFRELVQLFAFWPKLTLLPTKHKMINLTCQPLFLPGVIFEQVLGTALPLFVATDIINRTAFTPYFATFPKV